MGTPDFAVASLEALLSSGHEIIGIVTQPDRPKGRGKKVAYSPVKEIALKHGLTVYQPQRVKTTEFYQLLDELKPDLIVVVAFGQLLSKEILNHPPYGCVNVHASLLPRYRGAAPIHWSVIDGEAETGVTTMFMDEGLDTGDMIFKACIPIEAKDTTGVIHDKLARLGGEVLVATVKALEEGSAPRIPQDDALSCYAPLLTKEHEVIDWEKDAHQINNLVRGMNPWPGVYTYLDGKRLKIKEATVYKLNEQKASVGQVVKVLPEEGFVIQTGKGSILVTAVQLEGAKALPSPAFLRGYSLQEGQRLGC